MSQSHASEIKKLLGAFSGQANTLSIPRAYIAFTGSIEAAVLLSQIVYWSDGRTDDPEGWFYKTYKEWNRELSLSEYQVRKHSKQFQQLGFLETKVAKVKGDPTLHYRLDWDAFSDSLVDFFREPTERNLTNLVPEETQGTNPKDLKEPLYLQKLHTEITPEITFIVPERESAIEKASISETGSPSTPDSIAPVRESGAAAAPLQPRHYSSSENCDRRFDPLPPWQQSRDKFDFDPGFVQHVLTVYLPTVPCYKGQKITIDKAQKWINDGNYKPDRSDDVLLQWEVYTQAQSAKQQAEQQRLEQAQQRSHLEQQYQAEDPALVERRNHLARLRTKATMPRERQTAIQQAAALGFSLADLGLEGG